MKNLARLSNLLCGAIAAALLCSAGSASEIATWQLTTDPVLPGDQDTTSGSGSPNVSAADMARGAGLSATGATNSFNSTGWSGTDADDYVSFGFSVDPGLEVNLDSVLFGARSSNTGPGTLGLYSSIDSFSNPLQSFMQSGGDTLNWNLDISALGIVSGAVEFRIFEIGDLQADGVGATGNTGTFRLTDYELPSGAFTPVTITGELLPGRDRVPEGGASLIMLAFALGSIAVFCKVVPVR